MEKNKQLEKEVVPNKKIDATNLHSPIPLLRLKKELAVMSSEEILEIVCNDGGSGDDIANWCYKQGHTFLGEKAAPETSSYFVQKQK
ncbi:MAG: sulfurtransferase TusA family protein [Desulfopila sp.]|jgi:TusA-related sulfurtransferase|nr:sulfurtransferase TusA family protein [Desulfopila sp.]